MDTFEWGQILMLYIVCKDYTQVKSYLEGAQLSNLHFSFLQDSTVSTLTVAEQLSEGKRNILPLDD